MSGAIAGLLASLSAGSAPAPTNLVTNPSFTVNTVDWYSDSGSVSRDTVTFRSAPASLNAELGEGDPNPYYFKSGLLTIGQVYSLSIWIRTFNTQSFNITLNAGTSSGNLITASQSGTAPWTNYKIENVTCTGNGTLQIYIGCLYAVYIDDVSVVLGPTALVL